MSTDDNQTYDISVEVIRKLVNKSGKANNQIEKYFNNINNGNIPTWDERQHVNILLSAVFNKEEKVLYVEAKNQIKIVQVLMENFQSNQIVMMENIIKLLIEFNKINVFEISKFLGIVISFLTEPIGEIKKLLNSINEYLNSIDMVTIYYYINENNHDMYTQLSNPGMITRMFTETKKKGITSYYGHYTESLLRFAKMTATFNFEESCLIIKECINAGILRPCFRKEIIVNNILCECLKIAKENYWYSESEFIPFVVSVRNMISLMQDSTDGGGRSSYFNYILKKYCPSLFKKYCLDDGFTESSEKNIEVIYSSQSVQEGLTLEKLKEYYSGKVEGIDYSSKELWNILISYEQQKTGKLDILFEYFRDSHYPYTWGFDNCEYHHIPTAILWNNVEWSDKIRNFIMEQGGHAGLYNIIKMCAVIGEDAMGKKYFEQFVRLCEFLVFE